MNNTLLKTTNDRSQIYQDLQFLEERGYQERNGSSLDQVHPLTKICIELDDNPTVTKKSLSQLKKELELLPVAQITLAQLPTQSQIDYISEWSKKVLNKDVLIDITINPNLIAGIQISWRGVFFDGSLVKSMNNV